MQLALALHPDLKDEDSVEELRALLNLGGKGTYGEGIKLSGDAQIDARELLATFYNIEPDDDAGYERLGLRESKNFNYRQYLAEGWLFKEVLDRNNQELQVGDSVMVKGRKGTYGPTKITGFAQGGDEQYVKISGIEVDGKFTTMAGEWRVEKVDSANSL